MGGLPWGEDVLIEFGGDVIRVVFYNYGKYAR